MGGPPTFDVFAPISNPVAERLAALAAHMGRQTADMAALLFQQPMPTEIRERFEADTMLAISDLLGEFGQLAPDDRDRFRRIAALAMDRRLAHHAAMLGTEGTA